MNKKKVGEPGESDNPLDVKEGHTSLIVGPNINHYKKVDKTNAQFYALLKSNLKFT